MIDRQEIIDLQSQTIAYQFFEIKKAKEELEQLKKRVQNGRVQFRSRKKQKGGYAY